MIEGNTEDLLTPSMQAASGRKLSPRFLNYLVVNPGQLLLVVLVPMLLLLLMLLCMTNNCSFLYLRPVLLLAPATGV